MNAPKFTRPYTIKVTHDREEDLWVGVCDEIGLVTEAPTYNDLIFRARQIAPELHELNSIT
ncbi:DUF1902 domain-containing protein [Pectobacterium sp. 21LCBS03]|uniref:DUF1902 domain-containing protein n=1 Tax=Pectobacterium sp. 21LCBS03 TaxID=2935858 RepID=UPI0020107D7D|nr:DUF1902 domain-containing protein [Pectobacterium sp. 21LCBS03]UPY96272.1 DUF1902 domain-containing protein [Pectobacterium sp. 21LCBS03]